MLFKISIRIPYEIYHEILFCTKIVVSLTANAFEKMYVIKVFLANTTDLIIRFLLYIIKRVRMYTHCPKKENSFQCQRIWTKKKVSCYYENFTVIIYYKINTQLLYEIIFCFRLFDVERGFLLWYNVDACVTPFFILVNKIHIMCL